MRRWNGVTLLAALAGLLAFVACDSNNSVMDKYGQLLLAVTPSPIEATGADGAWTVTYDVTLQETQGLACKILRLDSTVYDPATGRAAAIPLTTSASQQLLADGDLLVMYGYNKVDAFGSRTYSMTCDQSLATCNRYVNSVTASKTATLLVRVRWQDDNGYEQESSVLIPVI